MSTLNEIKIKLIFSLAVRNSIFILIYVMMWTFSYTNKYMNLKIIVIYAVFKYSYLYANKLNLNDYIIEKLIIKCTVKILDHISMQI